MTSNDGGSIAPLVPPIMFALLALGGLVVDGVRELNGHGDAQAYAEEAARSGATAVKQDAPDLQLDEDTALTRIDTYCNAIKDATKGKRVTVTDCPSKPPTFTRPTTPATRACTNPHDIVVHVSVTIRVDTTLMGMVGFGKLHASASASARPYEGFNPSDLNGC